ncbi:MAG TPA: ATP-binding protein [Pyrinomonadaceae bacterium]|jgi:PAS domain S-box-containing protein|nr:ATP-binding protein [Pyrinomonadaceae bacterium]
MNKSTDRQRAEASGPGDASERALTVFEFGGGVAARAEGAATLGTVVETVRRILRADTASIASFSIEDRTITWLAMSGFQSVQSGGGPVVNPLRGEFAERAASLDDEEAIIEVRGLAGDLPTSEFPLHSAEGVRDLALVRLRARGEMLGVLAVGHREHHRFTAEERQQLEGLAEMVALALDNARLLDTLGAAKRVWEQTFDSIPDGIIVHDDRMTVVRCNMAAAEGLGLHPSDVAGMSCAEAFARLFGERAAAYHMRAGTARTTSSFELQAEDGRRYLVSVAPVTSLESGVWSLTSEAEGRARPEAETSDSASPAADPRAESSSRSQPQANPDLKHQRTPESRVRTNWSVITWSDITTLAEVQEQLARARRLATIGQLAAGVAHEINNPLAAITTCAEATLRDLRSEDETARAAQERGWAEYLEEIVRQALRCKQITRGLLDLSRQRRARREPVEINRLVEQAARIFEHRGHERGIGLELQLDESLGVVGTDEAMVRQILDNLLDNALAAVGDAGRVGVSTSREGERVRVEVSDDGPGITPDTLARVFDPFFTTKDPGRGAGLGLAISLTYAEAMGGTLTAESKPGAGARFRLWLPRRTPEKQ